MTKRFFLYTIISLMCFPGFTQTIYRLNYQPLRPDSVISFYNELSVHAANYKSPGKFIACGFASGYLGLRLNAKKERSVVFSVYDPKASASSKIITVVAGEDISKENFHSLAWNYAWKADTNYRFFIRVLPDSATNTTGYSAYFYAPELNAWKFIGTLRTTMNRSYLRAPFSSVEYSGEKPIKVLFSNAWLRNGSGKSEELNKALLPCEWRQSSGGSTANSFYLQTGKQPKPGDCDKLIKIDSIGKRPLTNINKNIDSVAQLNKEWLLIKKAVSDGVIDTTGSAGGVWYKTIKEGKGEKVNRTDTVTVFYKGYVLNGPVFDSTAKEPAVFPITGLIKGFQLGMPMSKVGGKIRMIIPSALAYGPANVAYDLPPNSVLVFDVEVLAAKKKE